MKYYEALAQAIDQCMAKDDSVYIMGLGVPDPSGIFGTTKGLQEKYGELRVSDAPTSENGNTSIAIGSALMGLRPIVTHHRVEFSLLAMEPLINQAPKWNYVFGNQVPMVIRMIIGRGWGQGPQHSQSLQALYSHIPGLKVVMPFSPYDVKGLFISSVEDNNPVIFIEHRWLYNTHGDVPEEMYRIPLGKARIVNEGKDATVLATSLTLLDAIKTANTFADAGIEVEVIDPRTLRPFDAETVIESVKKTGHFVTMDTAWSFTGFNAEAVAAVSEQAFDHLKSAPQRLGIADTPTPASASLAASYYPNAENLADTLCNILKVDRSRIDYSKLERKEAVDQPYSTFTGPF